MRFDPALPLERLTPAAYNPRALPPGALEALCSSIACLGFAKPVIATTAGLIVAGHQRTRAALALGLATVPAVLLDQVREADHVTFNQLHNGADLEAPGLAVRVPPSAALGWGEVEAGSIEGDGRAPGAHVRAAICDLVLRYGAWGSSVATQSGAVVASPHYALAARQLGAPLRVYRIADELEGEAREAFGRSYGAFSYAHLARTPWAQTWAQMLRLREGGERAYRSTLYDRHVLPSLAPGERLLDFGCGQGDYLARLRSEGRPAWGVEFFPRSGQRLDTRRAHELIDEALSELAARGPFDVVVCDSVLNSVDRPEAEADVLACVAALCRQGGRVYLSGRPREAEGRYLRSTKVTERRHAQRLKFFDDRGFTADFRRGAWFYQRFHTRAEVEQLGRAFGDDAPTITRESTSWQLAARCLARPGFPEVEAALRREFDLPWPEGWSVGRGEAAVAAWREAARLAA
jgi:ParB family chromosome partitioning protein